MKKVILDDVLRAKLFDLGQLLEFCDENGRVVGYFSPVVPEPNAYEGLEIPFTEEEIEKFVKREGKGRPLAAILADLEKLP